MKPRFGQPAPRRRRRARPVHPEQMQLVLLTLILGDGSSLQVLAGGRPGPEPVVALRKAVAA